MRGRERRLRRVPGLAEPSSRSGQRGRRQARSRPGHRGFGVGPGYSGFVNHTGVNSAYGGHALFGTIDCDGRCGCRLRNPTAGTCYRRARTPLLQRPVFRASRGQDEQSGAKGRGPRKEARSGSRARTEPDVTALLRLPRRQDSESRSDGISRHIKTDSSHRGVPPVSTVCIHPRSMFCPLRITAARRP